MAGGRHHLAASELADQSLIGKVTSRMGDAGHILAVIAPWQHGSPRSLARAELGDRAAMQRFRDGGDRRRGALVRRIAHAVTVRIAVAGIALPVAVEIGLAGIGDVGAVVRTVCNTIAVQIRITGVAQTIIVRVSLAQVEVTRVL